jgi:hypothetical protein
MVLVRTQALFWGRRKNLKNTSPSPDLWNQKDDHQFFLCGLISDYKILCPWDFRVFLLVNVGLMGLWNHWPYCCSSHESLFLLYLQIESLMDALKCVKGENLRLQSEKMKVRFVYVWLLGTRFTNAIYCFEPGPQEPYRNWNTLYNLICDTYIVFSALICVSLQLGAIEVPTSAIIDLSKAEWCVDCLGFMHQKDPVWSFEKSWGISPVPGFQFWLMS